jgi:hypothetical protein
VCNFRNTDGTGQADDPPFASLKKATAKLRGAVARRSWVLRGVNYAPASRRKRGPVALCPRLSPGLPLSLQGQVVGSVKYCGGRGASSSSLGSRGEDTGNETSGYPRLPSLRSRGPGQWPPSRAGSGAELRAFKAKATVSRGSVPHQATAVAASDR